MRRASGVTHTDNGFLPLRPEDRISPAWIGATGVGGGAATGAVATTGAGATSAIVGVAGTGAGDGAGASDSGAGP